MTSLSILSFVDDRDDGVDTNPSGNWSMMKHLYWIVNTYLPSMYSGLSENEGCLHMYPYCCPFVSLGDCSTHMKIDRKDLIIDKVGFLLLLLHTSSGSSHDLQ